MSTRRQNARWWAMLMAVVVTGTANARTASAQAVPADPRPAITVAPGWHPYVAVAPAIPLGRLADLTALGVFAKAGAWYVPRGAGVGVALDVVGVVLPEDTDEPLPGNYRIVGATVSVTSKARRRVFFEWLGGYGIGGVGLYRHGAGDVRSTDVGVNVGVGLLTPVLGAEGFVEARFHHLFSGETLGRGSGLTIAPLVIGFRF